MDHLWSPWRLEYVISKKPEGCVFCDAPSLASPDPLIVHRGQLAYVILNLYPYNNGHLMVVPKRHESSLAGLTREEMNEVGLLTQLSERALREAYKLEGINVGVNLGALPTKGLGLPLMSFGGSAMLMDLIALALVLRVDYENRVLMRGGRV